jgi:Leucine-rich repeat (LRR) protein
MVTGHNVGAGSLFDRARCLRRRLLLGSTVLALAAWSCSKHGGTGTIDEDNGEDNPPGAVTDLAVLRTTPITVTLGWTAPHGGSPTMLASSYDLRYAASVITEATWAQASEVVDEPGPAPAGTPQSMVVTGLPSDTTLCFALKSRGQAGLWSALSNCPAAVLPPETDVVFPDSSLDAVIRDIVGKPIGPLRASDVAGVTTIRAEEKGIASLEGLQNCPALNELALRGNSVTDLSPLAGLTGITSLGLSGNHISSLEPLAAMTRMSTLMLGDNEISDLGPLHAMAFLNTLYLNGNRIADVSPLAGCVRLNHLFLSANLIVDTGPLATLIYLGDLQLSYNRITDLAPLVANSGIGTGDEIWVDGNPLSETARTEQIPALRARGAVVHDR